LAPNSIGTDKSSIADGEQVIYSHYFELLLVTILLLPVKIEAVEFS